MKVTAIVGSPRRTGNSARLVEAVLEGAAESGAETSIHYLGEKAIKPCTGCYTCERTKKCVIRDDDMADIYPDMESADAYVFASPVYFDQVSGQFKTFLDRIFPYYWGKPLRGRKAVFTLVYENPEEDLYGHVVDWFTDMVEICHGIKFVGTLKVHGTGRNPVAGNPELLTKAKEMGRRLA